MRIIAGTFRSRQLKSLKGIALRPTSDKLRETLFNVLGELVVDARFVDRTLGPKPHVDVPAFTTAVLRERGIEAIVDTELCTRCPGSMFHSYRRDKKSGRNLAIVAA